MAEIMQTYLETKRTRAFKDEVNVAAARRLRTVAPFRTGALRRSIRATPNGVLMNEYGWILHYKRGGVHYGWINAASELL